jgi:YfiR/HmsC-like
LAGFKTYVRTTLVRERDMQIVILTAVKVEGMPSPWRVLSVLATVMLLLGGMRAQTPTAGEYQVKAAFLYNFAKFVDWPASSFSDASAALRICVFGRNPFGEELRKITNEKTVNGHKLEVHDEVDLEHARSCHILFIPSPGEARMKEIVEALRGASVLTVGNTKGFAERGGMINFVLENDRVQFEVNRKAAEESGLKISSKLLSVARMVIV